MDNNWANYSIHQFKINHQAISPDQGLVGGGHRTQESSPFGRCQLLDRCLHLYSHLQVRKGPKRCLFLRESPKSAPPPPPHSLYLGQIQQAPTQPIAKYL